MSTLASLPSEIAPVQGPAGDPFAGFQFRECVARSTVGETWITQRTDGRECVVRFFVGVNGENDQVREGLTLFRSLHHDALEPAALVAAGEHRLALISEDCPDTLASRFQECKAAGQSGVPRQELLARLKEAAKILDDLFQEYGLCHLGLTPKQILLRGGALRLRHFGVVELIQFPAGQHASALHPRYCAPELLEGAVVQASDAYSLALIYCEMLTGIHPLSSFGPRQLTSGRRSAQPDLSLVSAADRIVLQRAVHPDPNRRFESCSDFIAALGAASAPPFVLAEPLYTAPTQTRMRQFINGLVAEAAANLEVREFRNARYLLRPGQSLEHQFFARLTPGVAKLKVEGFRLHWNAATLEANEQRFVFLAPLSATLWQRIVGAQPGLKVRIDIPQANAPVAEVRVFIQPVHCSPETTAEVMEKVAPELLDSLRNFFQAQPDRRLQARLPFDKEVQVLPFSDTRGEENAVAARAQDISTRGMRIHMPCQPWSQRLNIRLCEESTGNADDLPASVVRVLRREDGGYEVCLRFLVEEGPPMGGR